MFENAKWVTKRYGIPLTAESAPMFRKRFLLKEKPAEGALYVCALGYGEYYINGKKVHEDVLTTPYTNYDKTILYNKYDVTKYLNEGENVFGVIVGDGPFHVEEKNAWKDACQTWFSSARFIMQLDVTYQNGETDSVVSNADCVWHDSDVIYNEWKMGEYHDNRLSIPDWSSAGYDDSDWNGTIVGFPPGGELIKNYIPPILITKRLPMKEIAENIYDCGQNLSGWVYLKVKGGKSGQEVKIIYSERYENGDFRRDMITELTEHPENKHIDKVILSGGGVEEFRPKFAYHGFRYVEIENAPEILEITAEFVHTDLKRIGNFSCSDETLNKLHTMIDWAMLSNYHSIPTDCPHREQNGWTADSMLSAQQAIMNYDMKDVYTKWIKDITDCQKDSGQIPCVVPQSVWGYGWGSCPCWDSPLFIIPYEMYQLDGNTEIVKTVYPSLEKYFKFAEKVQEDYIVNNGLGDWVVPRYREQGCKRCSVWIVETSYYYRFAKIMSEFSEILGKDSTKYDVLAENIRNAFRKKYFLESGLADETQTALATVVYQGLANDDEIPVLVKKLADKIVQNGYHHDCGIFGNKFIYTVLTENGYVELLYKLITIKTFPSYAYWIETGNTSLPENWDPKYASLNHHMFSEVGFWFYKYLAGIDISSNGLTIKPYFVKEIQNVKASRNGISVEYDMDTVKITTDRPANIVLGDFETKVDAGTYEYKISR